MSKKIGRIGDWNNNSQSGPERFVARLYLFGATSQRNSGPRQGSSGPRIATLGDTTQPDPPARHHVSDDEDEEEPGRGQGESWFAGGERRSASIISLTSIVSDPLPSSGISVENPGRPNFPGGSLVQDLLRRAAE